ncbi:DUF3108 domain-containing protein [Natronoflexus pectinivorans]|uniref:Uncharacterized protein DUF3108 n=1 Tax=Natronoflexus pectinivorans TaxID=682526 RepID=A0A4R2GLS2_9BACT|nr:DUF3108 domain-containing protein [Natronoflexus pectinivorans]TCO08441.1 uncharacterized protein DUF3108 [Natronoflexus pectinivorans]
MGTIKPILYIIIFLMAIMSDTASASNSPKTQNRPAYGPGEELHYIMSYGFITGGRGVLSVKDTILNGRHVHHLVGAANTVGLADRVFRVRNVYESFIDPKTDFPVKAIRNVREGSYRRYNEVLFDHGSDSTFIISQRTGEKYVYPNIYDIVAAFYVARKHHFNDDMVEGQVMEFMTYFSDEEFPLRIRYRGIEVINTRFGKVECYKFSPVTEVGRAFKTEDDMHVWITRDANRVPIRIRFNLRVGAFVCDLESFRGLQHPFSSIVH